jgi:hypothetical protein
MPPRIGAFDPVGAKVVLALYIDDYAVNSVNGEVPAQRVLIYEHPLDCVTSPNSPRQGLGIVLEQGFSRQLGIAELDSR